MKSATAIILSLFFTNTTIVIAQGCSDAGFCSLGDLNNQQSDNSSAKLNAVSIGIGYGLGFLNTNSINPYIEYQRKLKRGFGFQTKLTTAFTSGLLGNNSGLGDLFLSGTYHFPTTKQNDISFLLGAKIPVNDANNKNKNGLALPLDYQSSIGTLDIIIGSSALINKHVELSLAAQLPVINYIKNSFSPEQYTDGSANGFTATNHFVRQPDVLFRLGYICTIPKSGFSFKPNLLAIYHIGEDHCTDAHGNSKNITGSNGFTLNGVFNSTYTFKTNNQFELIFASPFIVRDIRPDGLTRSAVINLQYKLSF